MPSQTARLLRGKDGPRPRQVRAGEEEGKGQFCSQNCDMLVFSRGSPTFRSKRISGMVLGKVGFAALPQWFSLCRIT